MRAHLAPGGLFYIVDFHPFAAVFGTSGEGGVVPAHGYFPHEIFVAGGEPSYAGTEPIESPHYEWQHGLGEVVCALLDAGLRLEFLHEFPFTRYRAHPGMERGAGRLVAAAGARREPPADVLDPGERVRPPPGRRLRA